MIRQVSGIRRRTHPVQSAGEARHRRKPVRNRNARISRGERSGRGPFAGVAVEIRKSSAVIKLRALVDVSKRRGDPWSDISLLVLRLQSSASHRRDLTSCCRCFARFALLTLASARLVIRRPDAACRASTVTDFPVVRQHTLTSARPWWASP